MDYLIHFNPNHDPKTGRFTYIKNGWAIRKGYQNKDGSLSDSGKKALKYRQQHYDAYGKADEEAGKLMKANKKLREDFGDEYSIEDTDLFESTARGYGQDTSAYKQALKDAESLQKKYWNDKEYKKLVNAGEKMYSKMKDLNPDFYKKGYIENKSGATLASAFIAAFYGMPTIGTLTAISAIPEKVEENKYKKEYEKYKNKQGGR